MVVIPVADSYPYVVKARESAFTATVLDQDVVFLQEQSRQFS